MISPGPAFQEFTGSCPKGRIMGYVIVKAADVFFRNYGIHTERICQIKIDL